MNTLTEIQKITGGTQICSRNYSCRNSFVEENSLPHPRENFSQKLKAGALKLSHPIINPPYVKFTYQTPYKSCSLALRGSGN